MWILPTIEIIAGPNNNSTTNLYNWLFEKENKARAAYNLLLVMRPDSPQRQISLAQYAIIK